VTAGVDSYDWLITSGPGSLNLWHYPNRKARHLVGASSDGGALYSGPACQSSSRHRETKDGLNILLNLVQEGGDMIFNLTWA
jgi:hypothetical protein